MEKLLTRHFGFAQQNADQKARGSHNVGATLEAPVV